MLLAVLPIPSAHSNPVDHFINSLQHVLKKRKLRHRMAPSHRTKPQSDKEKKDRNLNILIGVACTLPILAVCGSLWYRNKRKKREAHARELGLSTVATVVSRLHQKAEEARQRMNPSMMSLAAEETPSTAESESWATPRSTGSVGSRTSRRSRESSRQSARVHPMPPSHQSSSLRVDTTGHQGAADHLSPPPIGIDDLPCVVRRRRHSSPTHRELPPSPTAEEKSRTPGLATRRLLARRREQLEQGENISARDMWAIARGGSVVTESHGGRRYPARPTRSAPHRRWQGGQVK